MGGSSRAGRDANDAGAYFAPIFYAVGGLCALQERLSQLSGSVVFVVKKAYTFNELEKLVS